jgi:putative transposase
LVSAGSDVFCYVSHGRFGAAGIVAKLVCAADAWLRSKGIDPASAAWRSVLSSQPDLDIEYHKIFTRQFMEYLDQGYGDCALRRPDLARIVAENLEHFDNDRYHLGDFVVMPNHVHLLVCLRGSTEIESQCRSWKKFTAGQINRALGRKGRFWQEESFDHIVRSPQQFTALRVYIAENPIKAKLLACEFLHRVCSA